MSNNISIVPFKYKYLPLLLEMLEDRKFDTKYTNMKTLPKIGYIALLNNQAIAAGFLRRVEGGYAQIDTLVSNTYYGSLIRHEGINKVLSALIQDAKDLKLNGIIGFTKDDGVLARVKSMGFQVLNYNIVSLSLLE